MNDPRPDPPVLPHNAGSSCPKCGQGPLYRTPRRWMDRVISWVRPVRRYRCHGMGCDWVGNLRHPATPVKPAAKKTPAAPALKPQRDPD